MNKINNTIMRPINPSTSRVINVPGGQRQPDNKINSPATDFSQILRTEADKLKEIKFSKHAEARLTDRNISLSREELLKMEDAVSKAENKGIRDSLVIMKDKAFIVNIPTKTVITAFDEQSCRDNIFTNIDGAVII